MKSLKQTILTTALVLGAFTANAHADYVVDGDFTNPYAGSSFQTYTAGQSFGAWTVTNGSVGFTGSVDSIGGYWQSPSSVPNAGSVDLDGNNPGAISQTLSTGVGQFLLTFSLSGNPDGGNALKSLGVSAGDVVSQLFTYTTGANTHGNMNYVTETLLFNSTTPTTNLVFSSLDATGAYGAVIGKISVSAVPLPAGLPMFAAALLGLFGFMSFRKRQQLA